MNSLTTKSIFCQKVRCSLPTDEWDNPGMVHVMTLPGIRCLMAIAFPPDEIRQIVTVKSTQLNTNKKTMEVNAND